MRPYSRKYDKEEHSYPKELEEVAKLLGRGAQQWRAAKARPGGRQ